MSQLDPQSLRFQQEVDALVRRWAADDEREYWRRWKQLGSWSINKTQGDVVIYPASGTGAWEAALVNTLSPGDRVIMAETGQFATLWRKLAERLGLVVEFIPGDWRHGADPEGRPARR